MSKSVLVIDTPENCYYCPLAHHDYIDNVFFCKGGKNWDNVGSIKPEWCPLSTLPPSISLKQYVDNAALNIESILNYQYAQGYNDCLEEIINKEGT